MHQERIYYRVIKKLLSDGLIAKNDRILVICAGRFDEEVLHQLGFTRVLLTDASKSWSPSHYRFRTCDAHRLPFADAGFDFSLVHAGLHHCHSPHLALLEMYRVAKKGVLVCEAQDNLFTRLLTRLSLGEKYELSAVKDKLGGVDGTSVPNFIYRWNKWEVEKKYHGTEARGGGHFNKKERVRVKTPHVHDPKVPGKVRVPRKDEIPKK